MKNYVVVGIVIIVLVLLGGLFGFIQSKRELANEKIDKIGVVIGNEIIEEIDNVLIENENVYFTIEIAKEYFDSNISITEDGKRAFIDISDKDFEMEDDSLTALIKDSGIHMNIPLKVKNYTKYLPINQLEKILGINVEYNKDSNIVIIDRFTEEAKFGIIEYDNINIYSSQSENSSTSDSLRQGDEVKIITEDNDWYKVRTAKGYFGYVEKKHVNQEIKNIEYDYRINHPRQQVEKEKINITWEYVYEKTPDISNEEKIEGLDVVSPTWFSLSDEGIVISKADFDYVSKAHEKGYKVWGLVDNGFDPDATSEAINSEDMKNKIIAQIAFYASLYDLDGINIDFENIYYEDKDAFVSFVEDLTNVLKKQNLIVSIDVTVPSGSKRWSKVYDRQRLAEIVDYVALMAYDEHWATSPTSGSVASIGWVERGIERSLNSIPKEKLLLGIPFYTRIWKETKDENGKINVSSKAIPIRNVEEILNRYDANVSWDEGTGQYFATYEEDGAIYKVWIEDTKSIELKVELAKKYGLKGIASWRKGYEYEEVWEVINTAGDEKDLL